MTVSKKGLCFCSWHFLKTGRVLGCLEGYLPKEGLMKAGCLNMAAPRKVLRPRGAPVGGRAEAPEGGGRPGKAAAAAAAAAAFQADSRAWWWGGKGLLSR